MRITQHVGLVKQGNRVIMQFAPTVDQLSCELWKYLGEFETDVPLAKIARKRKAADLKVINQAYGKQFTRLTIEEIAADDFTAGHVSTLPQEIAEYQGMTA